MQYLLDSNAWIAYLRRSNPNLIQRLQRESPTAIVLVTHNTAEFSRVPGLTIEDWQTP